MWNYVKLLRVLPFLFTSGKCFYVAIIDDRNRHAYATALWFTFVDNAGNHWFHLPGFIHLHRNPDHLIPSVSLWYFLWFLPDTQLIQQVYSVPSFMNQVGIIAQVCSISLFSSVITSQHLHTCVASPMKLNIEQDFFWYFPLSWNTSRFSVSVSEDFLLCVELRSFPYSSNHCCTVLPKSREIFFYCW